MSRSCSAATVRTCCPAVVPTPRPICWPVRRCNYLYDAVATLPRAHALRRGGLVLRRPAAGRHRRGAGRHRVPGEPDPLRGARAAARRYELTARSPEPPARSDNGGRVAKRKAAYFAAVAAASDYRAGLRAGSPTSPSASRCPACNADRKSFAKCLKPSTEPADTPLSDHDGRKHDRAPRNGNRTTHIQGGTSNGSAHQPEHRGAQRATATCPSTDGADRPRASRSCPRASGSTVPRTTLPASSISEGLRSQVGGLKVAVRNAQDGISVVQTAEGALTEVHAILQRMRDLAVQAANRARRHRRRARPPGRGHRACRRS